VIAAGCVVLSALAPAVQHQAPSAASVLAAATQYLADYQDQLRFLVADEQYDQQIFDASGNPTDRRRMEGEFFVTFAPELETWMSMHDVSTVDGQPVAEREDLSRLLQAGPLADVSRRLVEQNARYNIGRVFRNFNEPTLALQVLGGRRRTHFKFDRRAVAVDADAVVVTLAFKETDRPTLVRGTDGKDVPASGELTIEAGTGRIRRTEMRFTYGSVRAQLTTTYEREPKLDIWVPTHMTERYEDTKSPKQVIVCDATYTNYRRFEVRVRIR
jgi:hypothetical protein